MKEKQLVTLISPKKGGSFLVAKKEYGRNDKCPCGSGRKVKKCHSEYLETKYYSQKNK